MTYCVLSAHRALHLAVCLEMSPPAAEPALLGYAWAAIASSVLRLAGLVGEEGTVVRPLFAAQTLLCLQQLGQHGPELQLAVCDLQDSNDGVDFPG